MVNTENPDFFSPTIQRLLQERDIVVSIQIDDFTKGARMALEFCYEGRCRMYHRAFPASGRPGVHLYDFNAIDALIQFRCKEAGLASLAHAG